MEQEIELIQDGGQIKTQKDIYHYSPRPIPIICHLPDPPCFSLVTTFKEKNAHFLLSKNGDFRCNDLLSSFEEGDAKGFAEIRTGDLF